jgi:hypothetical protein
MSKYRDFYSIISIVKDDGLAHCTVMFTPKGKKYSVVCSPKDVLDRIDRLINKDIRKREDKLHEIRRKHGIVLDRLCHAQKELAQRAPEVPSPV